MVLRAGFGPASSARKAKTPTVSYTSLTDEQPESSISYSIRCSDGCYSTLSRNLCSISSEKFKSGCFIGNSEFSVDDIDWSAFKAWLEARRFSKLYVADCVSYSKKSVHLFFSGRFSELQNLRGRKHALRGLANLTKFLGNGLYGRFRSMVQESGLRWNDCEDADWAFFNMWNSNVANVLNWLEDVKEKLGFEYWFPLAFQGLVGLRTCESMTALNLIAEGKLCEYLDRERMILAHFKYRDLFLRGGKKCFFSVVTDEIVERLESWTRKMTYGTLQKRLERNGLEVKTYELRKFWATKLRQAGVQQEVIDMCQGRVPANTFIRHYWRPEMGQLIETVRKVVEKLQNEIS